MGASQSKSEGDKVFYNETPIQVCIFISVSLYGELTRLLAVFSRSDRPLAGERGIDSHPS
jgi:hypothetical protein